MISLYKNGENGYLISISDMPIEDIKQILSNFVDNMASEIKEVPAIISEKETVPSVDAPGNEEIDITPDFLKEPEEEISEPIKEEPVVEETVTEKKEEEKPTAFLNGKFSGKTPEECIEEHDYYAFFAFVSGLKDGTLPQGLEDSVKAVVKKFYDDNKGPKGLNLSKISEENAKASAKLLYSFFKDAKLSPALKRFEELQSDKTKFIDFCNSAKKYDVNGILMSCSYGIGNFISDI